MKFVVDLLKLLAVVLPLVGDLIKDHSKKKNVKPEDVKKEDEAILSKEEELNSVADSIDNNSVKDNSNIPNN